jgi:hypothetical protein
MTFEEACKICLASPGTSILRYNKNGYLVACWSREFLQDALKAGIKEDVESTYDVSTRRPGEIIQFAGAKKDGEN